MSVPDPLHRPAIAAHRLVGDGRSVVLVRPDAEVDWWCAPDIDSAPLAWSLLDPAGGACRFPGLRYAGGSTEPAGPTARSVLAGPAGRVEVRDGLLPTDDGDGIALVRVVRGLDADLDVEHELRLGGADGPAAMWRVGADGADGAVADVGQHVVQVRASGGAASLDVDESGGGTLLAARLRAPLGEAAVLTVAVDGGLRPDPHACGAALEAAEAAAKASLAGCRLPRRHPGRALDALRVLRACTYRPTGAVVASPTTSLPEAPGHERQYDYRYSWIRDSSLAVAVAALLGQPDDVRRFLGFLHGLGADGSLPAAPVVTVRGTAVPAERELDVGGWAGSQPVRVGNEAGSQVQYDARGLLVEAVSAALQTGSPVDDTTWAMVRGLADEAAGNRPGEVLPSNGIWELREKLPLVDGDIGRWLLLDRALWIARLRHPFTPRRRWKRARDVIAHRILAAIDPATGLLPQAYGQHPPRPDASALLTVIFGLLGDDDPRARRLVEATVDALDAAPYLYRYPPDGADGFSGTEGAFLPVSAWAVTALALTGQVERARERLDALCAALPRLLSEEVDPVSGAALGNVPLVWSHVELARALYVLDAAERRARWGGVGLWVWRLARYAALRSRH